MKLGIRELIFLAVLLAVPVASFIFVFKPHNDEIQQARAEIERKQKKLEQLQQMSAHLDDLGLAIEEGRQAIDMIEAKLPREQQVDGILEQVAQLAKNNNMIVTKVKTEDPVPAAMYMELPLNILMEGDFDGFYNFLLELENLRRITRVHSMKLQRVDELRRKTDEHLPPGSMKADFTLSIYFQPEPIL